MYAYDLVVLRLRWLDAVFVPSHFMEVASKTTCFPALGLRRFVLKNCSGNGTRLNDQLLQAAASKRHRVIEGRKAVDTSLVLTSRIRGPVQNT